MFGDGFVVALASPACSSDISTVQVQPWDAQHIQASWRAVAALLIDGCEGQLEVRNTECADFGSGSVSSALGRCLVAVLPCQQPAYMTFGNRLNHSLEGVKLTSCVQIWIFGAEFGKGLDFVVLPKQAADSVPDFWTIALS
jgi:hypothetical protein